MLLLGKTQKKHPEDLPPTVPDLPRPPPPPMTHIHRSQWKSWTQSPSPSGRFKGQADWAAAVTFAWGPRGHPHCTYAQNVRHLKACMNSEATMAMR